jgi:hypothetical protein
VTVIAVRDGTIAADSRVTVDSEGGGSRAFVCTKLYLLKEMEVVIGVSGEGFAALRFVEWYQTIPMRKKGRKRRDTDFINGDASFSALVLHKSGKLEEFDRWLIPEEVMLGPDTQPFYATGSGCKAALGAMSMGATARQAAEIACRWDPYCAPPVVSFDISKDL